jgi:polysaccharide pyruvyl transferase WcaK-like protein
MLLCALVIKILPWKNLRNKIIGRNCGVKTILEADIIFDITGGDSFSDIYGMGRFIRDFLCKWLVTYFKKRLVMLPQTYGPFNRRITRFLAVHILKRTFAIYARDPESLEYVEELLKEAGIKKKIEFVPDLAFVLEPRKPDAAGIWSFLRESHRDGILVGMNVSGLLFSGGYTYDNMFNLKIDYRKLTRNILEMLMSKKNLCVVLVPHVFSALGDVESDLDACSQLYRSFSDEYSGRFFLIEGNYDQSEIKYIIGQCDFFLGSRMHSCIAALSQGIPTLALAYSRKFRGVFDSIGVGQMVVDLRTQTQEQILHAVRRALSSRQETARTLRETIPKVQETVSSCLESVSEVIGGGTI